MRSNHSALARDIKEKATESLHVAKEKVIETSREAAARVDADVRKRPWQYLGVVAFVTTVFGFFLGRKSKRP